ncbi:MAG: hypothetical protein H0S79_03680 [Anaerolineaceae bacterium]|nr:hypothetical protein [Anaerolineaceae bacterium]
MTVHLYLSLVPEALIASMLSPEEFGSYYAVGTKKKSSGQALFFEIDPEYRSKYLRIEEGISRCVPHDDGTPKSSIYISVYRVLEHIDISALGKFYMVTQDGRTLGLEAADSVPDLDGGLHLYKEIAPVSPLVASRLNPVEFYDLIVKNPTSLVTLPAIAYAELRLGELAEDPDMGQVGDLPYSNLDHLRETLKDLKTKPVATKMVDRASSKAIAYRTVKNGIYVGNESGLRFYPMPSNEDLKENHYRWWRSANM